MLNYVTLTQGAGPSHLL